MNSTKGTKTSKTPPVKNEKISRKMDALVKQLRIKGVSASAYQYLELILTEQKVLLDEINSYIDDLQLPQSDS